MFLPDGALEWKTSLLIVLGSTFANLHVAKVRLKDNSRFPQQNLPVVGRFTHAADWIAKNHSLLRICKRAAAAAASIAATIGIVALNSRLGVHDKGLGTIDTGIDGIGEIHIHRINIDTKVSFHFFHRISVHSTAC